MLTAAGDKKPPRCRDTGAAAGHLDRRFESAEAAKDLVVLLDLLLASAFDALDAIDFDVRTEFLAILSPPFILPINDRRQRWRLCKPSIANLPAAVNEISY